MNAHQKAIDLDLFRLLISHTSCYAVYTLSSAGEITSWNAGAVQSLGYTEREILGKHFSILYTDEDRALGLPIRTLHEAAEGKSENAQWLVRKDGSRFWSSTAFESIHNVSGEVIGFTGIMCNGTSSDREREGSPASEEQFRLLVQSVVDYAIYLISPDGIVTSWNAGAERIKGYSSSEIVGKHFSCFYTEEDRNAGLPAFALKTAEQQGRFEREGWRVRKDGSRFWAHILIDPVRDRLGRVIGFAKVTRDITERRHAEEARLQNREAHLQSQKLEAIGKLTGGISHDFNNLLNVIVNGLHLLRQERNRDVHLKTIETMERAAKRGASLTQQLLAFARQQPLKLKQVDINRVLLSFEDVLRRAISDEITLRLQLEPELPKVLADEAQLEAAILNLVVNARDAINGKGAIVVSTEFAPTSTEELALENAIPGHVQIRITDTGAGMTNEVAKRAIEPFYTTKGPGKGSGLGLSQVFGVMGQAGGKLAIDSEPGVGTCITMIFPALASVGMPKMNTRLRVLVVDDEFEVLEMAASLLDNLGYDVVSATSSEEALVLLRQDPSIRILFSDVVMPGMSGLELACCATEQDPTLKVVLASGYMSESLREQCACKGEGKFPLLIKPYSPSDVLRHLKA